MPTEPVTDLCLVVDKVYVGTLHSLLAILGQFKLEDVRIKKVVQLLVGHIDTKLLEARYGIDESEENAAREKINKIVGTFRLSTNEFV